MERLLTNELFLWKNKRNRKPLILTGARQVGKTWILKNFSASYFSDSLYIDLKKNSKVKSLFDDSIPIRRSIEILGALFGKPIEPYKTLLILDNIQELNNFEKTVKRFLEEASQYFICCTTINQHIINKTNSFYILNLQPLNFEEFLLANQEEELIDFFKGGTLTYLPKLIENKLMDYLKLYFVIGGMPSAVATWVRTRDFIKVEKKLLKILDTYQEDIKTPKISSVWNSLPKQLEKENHKFMYDSVRAGARAREYQESLNWILNHSYGTAVFALKDPNNATEAEVVRKSFRIFLPDIGLLRIMYDLPYHIIKFKNKVFEEYNYALTLQFIFQELLTKIPKERLYYWTSGATAQIDFLIQHNQQIYPLEVNLNDNLKARSIRIYQERFTPQQILRTTLSSFQIENSFIKIPLCLLFNFEHYLTDLL